MQSVSSFYSLLFYASKNIFKYYLYLCVEREFTNKNLQKMNQNMPLLAICIPTYNRCEILIDCLRDTISKVGKYNFPIIVTDNASTDDTQQQVLKIAKEYPALIYHRQTENIGADRNFESCLKLSPATYSWLLGDSYRIVEEELDTLAEIMEHKEHCAIINNSLNRVIGIPSTTYSDSDRLLYDIGWHMTMICSLILSRELIHNTNFTRYYNTNFIQDGIIFEYLTTHPSATVYWHGKSCNTVTPMPKTSWLDKRWDIFGINWTAYVLSLPSTISLPTKCKCIIEHNQRERIFSIRKTIRLRYAGHFNIEVLHRSKLYQRYFWDVPYIIPYFIATAPKWLLRLIFRVK